MPAPKLSGKWGLLLLKVITVSFDKPDNQEISKLTSPNNPSRAEPYSVEPKGRAFALQIVVAQLAFSCVLSLFGLVFSSQVAIAILLGGMICSSANTWLAIVAFRPALGKPPGEMLAAFYVGEIGKFVVTALLFLVVFTQFALFKQPIYALLIFVAYVLVQSMAWVYPLARSWLFKNKGARRG
jgi:ATP synthase protein I